MKDENYCPCCGKPLNAIDLDVRHIFRSEKEFPPPPINFSNTGCDKWDYTGTGKEFDISLYAYSGKQCVTGDMPFGIGCDDIEHYKNIGF